MGIEFFQTRMGQMFFEGTTPRIAKALERIADALSEPKLKPEPEAGPAKIEVSEEFLARTNAAITEVMVAAVKKSPTPLGGPEPLAAFLSANPEFSMLAGLQQDVRRFLEARYQLQHSQSILEKGL